MEFHGHDGNGVKISETIVKHKLINKSKLIIISSGKGNEEIFYLLIA